MIDRQPVRSSNVQSVGYDAATQTLEIAFHSGAVYRYAGVPESVWCAFMISPSKGQYVHRHIKDRYPTRRIL